MKYNLDLQGNHPDDRLRFEIDLDAGTITGDDAELARQYLKNATGEWIIYGTQSVTVNDPLHDPRDLAIALEPYWPSIPQELLDLLPPAKDVPDGAVA